MGELAVAVYEGTQYDDVMDRTRPRSVKLIIKVGETRPCEGCSQVKLSLYVEGSWLCKQCIVDEFSDELAIERAEIED